MTNDNKTSGPGFRLFACDFCDFTWKDASRDCTSFSGEPCPNSECEDGPGYLFCPIGYERHPEWPMDKFGNLLEGHNYE